MIGYHVEFKGYKEQLAKLRDYNRIADKHLKSAMTRSVVALESAIVPEVPVGVSARLRNSIASEVIHEGPLSIIGKVGSTLKNEIYPIVMEFGRRPGARMPPPAALERWVHLQLKVPAKDAPGVAFLVARAIAIRGIRKREYMKKGWEKTKERVYAFFDTALQAIAKELENGRH